MKFPRPIAAVVALGLIAALAIVASCNNSNNNGGILTPPARELDSGNIANGGVFPHTFHATGTFNYHCTIHGTGMAGQVIVVPGASASQAVTIGPGNFYNPNSVSVDTGGTVTWTNTGVTHTVTSN
jgi:plastocyanin